LDRYRLFITIENNVNLVADLLGFYKLFEIIGSFDCLSIEFSNYVATLNP